MDREDPLRPSECSGLKRTRPKTESHVPEDVVEELQKEFRTIPEFEKQTYEYICRKHWSLDTNDYLACHWKEYITNLATRKRVPILFPSAIDYHFHLADTRYAPDQSLRNVKSFRYRMRLGPGVDDIGQIPIPNDMHLRQTVGASRKVPGAAGRASKIKLAEMKKDAKKVGKK